MPHRREFIEYLVWAMGLAGASLVASLLGAAVITSSRQPEDGRWIDLGPVSQLSKTPTRIEFSYTRRQGWQSQEHKGLVYGLRAAEGEPILLSPVCSHLGCTVHWEDKQKEFRCPCHQGVFDSEGYRLSGPPTEHLRRRQGSISGERILIRLT